MIKDLRKKFIRITMFAVAMVMILLCLIVNAANYLSVNSEINQKLDMIYENQGTIPMPAKDGKPRTVVKRGALFHQIFCAEI